VKDQSNLTTKVHFILENFNKFGIIYNRVNSSSEIEDMVNKIFLFIVPIVFIDFESYELNFAEEEIKQEVDYRVKFFENICKVTLR